MPQVYKPAKYYLVAEFGKLYDCLLMEDDEEWWLSLFLIIFN